MPSNYIAYKSNLSKFVKKKSHERDFGTRTKAKNR